MASILALICVMTGSREPASSTIDGRSNTVARQSRCCPLPESVSDGCDKRILYSFCAVLLIVLHAHPGTQGPVACLSCLIRHTFLRASHRLSRWNCPWVPKPPSCKRRKPSVAGVTRVPGPDRWQAVQAGGVGREEGQWCPCGYATEASRPDPSMPGLVPRLTPGRQSPCVTWGDASSGRPIPLHCRYLPTHG